MLSHSIWTLFWTILIQNRIEKHSDQNLERVRACCAPVWIRHWNSNERVNPHLTLRTVTTVPLLKFRSSSSSPSKSQIASYSPICARFNLSSFKSSLCSINHNTFNIQGKLSITRCLGPWNIVCYVRCFVIAVVINNTKQSNLLNWNWRKQFVISDILLYQISFFEFPL